MNGMVGKLDEHAAASELNIEDILQSTYEEFKAWSKEGLELSVVQHALLYIEWKVKKALANSVG